MLDLWILNGLAVLLCVGTAVTAVLVDRQPKPHMARRAMPALDLGLVKTGLLSGGVARAVDAQVVDLVERGLAHADGGVLTIIDPEVLADLDRPAKDARLPEADAFMLVSVRNAGSGGIDSIRRDALKLFLRFSLLQMARQRLLRTPLGRMLGPGTASILALILLFTCTMIIMLGAGSKEEKEIPLAVSLALWAPVSILTLLIWRQRPGLHGSDPLTALGRDVVTLLRSDLPAEASQAQRVALGGFAAMTDDGLRRAIQGSAVDSQWDLRRASARSREINAIVAGSVGWIEGLADGESGHSDGGHGGDSGDDGGGGDGGSGD